MSDECSGCGHEVSETILEHHMNFGHFYCNDHIKPPTIWERIKNFFSRLRF